MRNSEWLRSFSGCCFSAMVVVTLIFGISYNIQKRKMLTEKEINLIRREYPTPKILAKMILPKSDKEYIVTKEQKMGKFEQIHKKFIKVK